jgi:hypothetical protein
MIWLLLDWVCGDNQVLDYSGITANNIVLKAEGSLLGMFWGEQEGIFRVLVLVGRLQDEGCTRLWISNKLQVLSL